MLREIAGRGVSVVVISSDFEELLGISERIVVMSDGFSIADLPSAHLDEEKLTLLAAPRTSMERNTQLLDELTRSHGGAGFWAIIDQDRLICLNTVLRDDEADPGFRAGQSPALAETRIAEALQRREDGFVTDSAGRLSTFLMPVPSRRGHDLGWIGLTVTDNAPPEADVRRRVHEFIGSTEEMPAAQ